MTNMTAVEWAIQYLNNVKPNEFCSIETIKEVLQQALEMEKQQIIDANIAGLIYPYVPGKPFGLEIAEQSKAEQYYSETYKSNKPICKCENTERIEVGSGSWNIHCKDCGKNW